MALYSGRDVAKYTQKTAKKQEHYFSFIICVSSPISNYSQGTNRGIKLSVNM